MEGNGFACSNHWLLTWYLVPACSPVQQYGLFIRRMAVSKPSSTQHSLRSAPWKLNRRVERHQPTNRACFVRWTTVLPLPDFSVIASGSITVVSFQNNTGVDQEQGPGFLLVSHNAMPYVTRGSSSSMMMMMMMVLFHNSLTGHLLELELLLIHTRQYCQWLYWITCRMPLSKFWKHISIAYINVRAKHIA